MVNKYIIMCGGNYKHWKKPRHLSVIKGEELVERTIRLLKENGIKDISISSNNPIFEKFGIPVLKHDNLYNCRWHDIEEGSWFNCFYPTNEPVCYIFGDVYFSDEAIKTIIKTETDDIEFFGSKPPFADNYIKDHEEPFALKVANQKHLYEAIEKTKELDKQGKFWRKPLMWELWTVIKDVPLQKTKGEFPADYIVINDYTCDIDWEEDIKKLEKKLGGNNMIKVKALQDFTLERFGEIKNMQRGTGKKEEGWVYKTDIFECEKELCDYLLGNNKLGKAVVEVIEVVPEKVEVKIEEPKVEKIIEKVQEITKPKATSKKTPKKKKTSKK